jgi:hypothetical protein
MGEETSDSNFIFKTPEKVLLSVNRGLSWMAKAQNMNGGWGAGNHSRQDVVDPHAVPSDPAPTSMVAIALLRSDHTFAHGEYGPQIKNALEYLLKVTETSSPSSLTITEET